MTPKEKEIAIYDESLYQHFSVRGCLQRIKNWSFEKRVIIPFNKKKQEGQSKIKRIEIHV